MAIITCMTYMLHLLNIFSNLHDLINDHDLINISISSHHQVNEINYQCLKNTLVFVPSRSVTLNTSTDSKVMRSSSATEQISIYDDCLFRVFSMHQY